MELNEEKLDKKSISVTKNTGVNKKPPKRKKAPPKVDPNKEVKSTKTKSTSNISKSKKATTNTMARATNIEPVDSNIESKDVNQDLNTSNKDQLITDPKKKNKKEKESVKDKLKRMWSYYTTYEKVWFITITIASFIVAILFPEEDINGVNGGVIMGLYLSNIFLNILCELLIAKQSKWNFIISLAVEASEIALCVVLKTMFISFLSIIVFWIPIDIISFISWNKHKDDEDEELTEVRELKGWQKLVFYLAVIVWTIGVGYLSARFSPDSDIYASEMSKRVVAYLDACESAIGVANGLFIMLRFKEQWGTWIIATILEGAMNIILGQWVLLVLKAGYLTNSIYGYVKWSKYIKHKESEQLITKIDPKKEKPKEIKEVTNK